MGFPAGSLVLQRRFNAPASGKLRSARTDGTVARCTFTKEMGQRASVASQMRRCNTRGQPVKVRHCFANGATFNQTRAQITGSSCSKPETQFSTVRIKKEGLQGDPEIHNTVYQRRRSRRRLLPTGYGDPKSGVEALPVMKVRRQFPSSPQTTGEQIRRRRIKSVHGRDIRRKVIRTCLRSLK